MSPLVEYRTFEVPLPGSKGYSGIAYKERVVYSNSLERDAEQKVELEGTIINYIVIDDKRIQILGGNSYGGANIYVHLKEAPLTYIEFQALLGSVLKSEENEPAIILLAKMGDRNVYVGFKREAPEVGDILVAGIKKS